MITTVVAGNPNPSSRTLDAGAALVHHLTGAAPTRVIDVITLGSGLLTWGDAGVASAVESVATSDLVVFASPTYKATYTGVLKLFLDQFAGATGLEGVVAVPLMLGAGPAHAMAPEYLLKPVLVELGAITPAPGLYLHDRTAALPESSAQWRARWSAQLLATVASARGAAAGFRA